MVKIAIFKSGGQLVELRNSCLRVWSGWKGKL